MFNWIIKKIIGSKHQRVIKRLSPIVAEINRIEQQLQSEPEEALRDRVAKWKAQFRAFHTPPFLSGVPLRMADEAQLNECLVAVADYFDLLTPHFASLNGKSLQASTQPSVSADDKRAAIVAAQAEWEGVCVKFSQLERDLLEKILPEVYAVVKNAARRMVGTTVTVTDQPLAWNMVHFDVQLIGGIALHRGFIAEMATGEGKTLVGTLPVALNALTGRGVHVVTVNDYLARRDSEWMGALYKFIGLTVGVIQNDQRPEDRRAQYECDITYGTNSEFGFDYLRDNGMATSKDYQVQRGHYFAIVDEVDSVLIDEARTPLIISGQVTVATHQFDRYKPLVEQLTRRQNQLCARLITEAKEAFEKGDHDLAGRKLYQVALGQPKNRALLRCMEDPDMRRLKEKTEARFSLNEMKVENFKLKEELYFSVEERSHESDLTEMGRTFMNPDDPDSFVLPDIGTAFAEIDVDASLTEEQKIEKRRLVQEKLDHQGQKIHNITQLLRAYCLYEKDVHYVVEENKVVIVDEHTGRKMTGRRWSDGLHGAVEAKEGVNIDAETQTLATITIQNYFRLYQKLAGMTGTAETDAAEFHDIYRLDVLPIPTNRAVKRVDMNDSIYKTRREKFNAVIDLIAELNTKGQPVLVGTASVDSSETLSRMLKQRKIGHALLNAKYHRQEAEIVSKAGQLNSVTISTNMAGRGTDIKLGEGVEALGGLFVLGTERHESRRVDRQLRGRCARQGDSGMSRFFLSFEDDLMRRFGAGERMTKMLATMDKVGMGMKENEELEHPMLNRVVENAQKRVEQYFYTSRKRTLEYDDVMNKQREVVYEYRNEVLDSSDTRTLVDEAIEKGIADKVAEYVPADGKADAPIDYRALLNWINATFPVGLSEEEAQLEQKSYDEIVAYVTSEVKAAYDLLTRDDGPDDQQRRQRYILLEAIDKLWQEHLYVLDGLREGVGLRAHGQKDPLIEFKIEAYQVFEQLMQNINGTILGNLFKAMSHLRQAEEAQRRQHMMMMMAQQAMQQAAQQAASGSQSSNSSGDAPAKPQGIGRFGITMPTLPVLGPKAPAKAGPNDPCPCGSGKKYKKCCGRLA